MYCFYAFRVVTLSSLTGISYAVKMNRDMKYLKLGIKGATPRQVAKEFSTNIATRGYKEASIWRPAVLCSYPQSDTPRQGYNGQLISNHRESLYER